MLDKTDKYFRAYLAKHVDLSNIRLANGDWTAKFQCPDCGFSDSNTGIHEDAAICNALDLGEVHYRLAH